VKRRASLFRISWNGFNIGMPRSIRVLT